MAQSSICKNVSSSILRSVISVSADILNTVSCLTDVGSVIVFAAGAAAAAAEAEAGAEAAGAGAAAAEARAGLAETTNKLTTVLSVKTNVSNPVRYVKSAPVILELVIPSSFKLVGSFETVSRMVQSLITSFSTGHESIERVVSFGNPVMSVIEAKLTQVSIFKVSKLPLHISKLMFEIVESFFISNFFNPLNIFVPFVIFECSKTNVSSVNGKESIV